MPKSKMTKTKSFKPPSSRLMFQWIKGVKKLDVLYDGQIRLFVKLWTEFEFTRYMINLQHISSLTINNVLSVPDKQHYVVSFTYAIKDTNDIYKGEFVLPYSAD